MDETLLALDLVLLTNSRREYIGGREYVVATAVILKEQVLNGSDGPLFYSLTEISQDVGVWNGYPLTSGHPFAIVNGVQQSVSARVPEIAHKFQVGTLYNDRMVGNERQVDVWIDVQNANRIDPNIVPNVLTGKPINVSTGIFTKKREAVQNAQYNGKGYTHTVFNIKPDHLAVLMGERGACSVGDGCGINVHNSTEVNNMATCPKCGKAMNNGECSCGYKTKMTENGQSAVTYLVGNCDCWKGKADVLNALEETQVVAIKNAEEKNKQLVTSATLVINQLKTAGIDPTKPIEEGIKLLVENAKKVETPKPPEPKPDTSVTLNSETLTAALKQLGEGKVLELFPTLNQTVATAKSVIDDRKVEVIRQLVVNIENADEKKAKAMKYKEKDLPTLNEYLEVMNSVKSSTPVSTPKDDADAWYKAMIANDGKGNQPTPSNPPNNGHLVKTVYNADQGLPTHREVEYDD